MCDQESFDDMLEYQLRVKVSRRSFNALALGAGLASALPAVANAVKTLESDVQVKTPDGVADGYFVHPAEGKHPGVLIWPDIFGLRPSFREMGRLLAESGYSVLVVNPFYRTRKAPTSSSATMEDPEVRRQLMALRGTLNAQTGKTDGQAFIAWLDTQASVDKSRKMATTGYCMAGPLVFQTAAVAASRVGAGATFHGGGLATDKPDSPHLLIPQMKAQFLIAIAENDDAKEPEAKTLLKDAFAKENLSAQIEVYEGALHGWCPPDSRVYHEEQAEKAWARMLALFRKTLA